MKMALVLLSGIFIMSEGCSTLHQVELGQKERWIADAQNDLLGRDATVVTRDGRGSEGQITHLNSDSLWVREEKGGSIRAFEVDQVSSIRQPKHVWPVVGGFFAGGLAGAFIGGSIAAAAEEPRLEVLGFNTVAEGIGGAAIGTLIGCVAGASILGLATSVTDYQIIYSPPRSAPVRPAQTVPDTTWLGK